MSKIEVKISSSFPIFIEADANSFGEAFSHMNDDEQVRVFRAMVEHMKPHRMQWDYIAIALEKDENRDVYNDLSVLFPSVNELITSVSTLTDALKTCITHIRAIANEEARPSFQLMAHAQAVVDAAEGRSNG